MKNIADFTIETERLLLIPISLAYRDNIYKEFTLEVARYLVPQPTGNIENTIYFINDSREKNLKNEALQLIAIDKISKEFLGCVGLHDLNTKIPELGLWFKKSVWGKGYGKESMAALKNWADKNINYEYISYPIFKENIASQKIAEYLGGEITEELISKNQNGIEFNEVKYLIRKN